MEKNNKKIGFFKKIVKNFFILLGISFIFIIGGFIYSYFGSKHTDKKYKNMEDKNEQQ